MKNKKIWLYLLIIVLFSGQVIVGKVRFPRIVSTKMEIISSRNKQEPTVVLFQLISKKEDLRKFSLKLEHSKKIIYSGKTDWSIDMGNDSIYQEEFTLTIPDNDTSKFQIDLDGSHYQISSGLYFITTRDTIEIAYFDPWITARDKFGVGGPGAWTVDTTLPRPTKKPKPKEPKRGEVFPPKKIEVLEANPEDVQREMMRRLEENPLTDRRSEEIKVGDRWYQRFRGETKFKLVEPQTEGKKDIDQLYQEWKDSVDSIPDDTPYKACLFLDDTVKYRIADELIDNKLEPTGHPYRYHVTTTKGILYKLLKEYKIKLNFRNERDHIHLDSNEIRFISPQ